MQPTTPPAPSPSRTTGADLSQLTGRVHLPPELARASGMKRLDWILSHPEPADFVGALAPQELFYWIRDIGREDAYVLLEYANQEQLRGLVEIDAWSKNEFQVARFIEWLDLALAVDVETAQRLLTAQENEVFLWIFMEGVEVLPADADLDMIPDDRALFHTPDAMYVITTPRGHILEERIPQLVRLMWAADMARARVLLQQVQFELKSNNEEECIRVRNAHLMELGFEPPIEALEVYTFEPPIAAREEIRTRLPELANAITGVSDILSHQCFDPVLKGVAPPDMLRAAIEHLSPEERLRVGDGLAYLTNKVFMADVGDLSRIEDLPDYAARAAGFANLGLAYLADDDEGTAARILGCKSVEHCFRVGHSLVASIAKRARTLARRAGRQAGFEIFGTPTDEIIDGLMMARPMYFEGLDDVRAIGWRAFRTLDDLALVDSLVKSAEELLAWFETQFGFAPEHLDSIPDLSSDARRRIRLDTLFRTGLANTVVHDAFTFAPLDRESLAAFARMAFTRDGKAGPALTPLLKAADDAPEAVRRFVERAVDGLLDAVAGIAPADLEENYASEVFIVRAGSPD